jgi:hypothetical protein
VWRKGVMSRGREEDKQRRAERGIFQAEAAEECPAFIETRQHIMYLKEFFSG